MKVYISENIDKVIEGFSAIPIVYGVADFSSIPNNGASTIVAIDALDSIKPNDISQFINTIISKMRINCELFLGGIDAYSISKDLVSGKINVDEYNKIISGKNGIYSLTYIVDILLSNNIKILSTVFRGNNYEISATRLVSKN